MKVLLIHGLARTPLSLSFLEWQLRQAGCHTEHFSYVAFAESFDSIVQRLQTRLRTIAHQEPYSVVVHSLGGLLVRAALDSNFAAPEHIVMLGTPNQAPRLATFAWRFLPFQWFTGQCGFNLTDAAFFAALPPLNSPYTIVAGTGGPRGRWSPFGPELNDGIVALSETRLSPQDVMIQCPVIHTFMMNDPQVQQAVIQALGLERLLQNREQWG